MEHQLTKYLNVTNNKQKITNCNNSSPNIFLTCQSLNSLCPEQINNEKISIVIQQKEYKKKITLEKSD
jgi:hypothetical protein